MSYRVTITVDLAVRTPEIAVNLAETICQRIEESWFVATEALVEEIEEVSR